MRNLFAYGTLMCGDIMREVAGCLPASLPGVLQGYRRRTVRGEHYPGLVPGGASRVDGVLYRAVPGFAWARLDDFEGDMYLRHSVRIELPDGATLSAETYLVRPQFLARLGHDEWSYAEFLRSGKEQFCDRYRGYARVK